MRLFFSTARRYISFQLCFKECRIQVMILVTYGEAFHALVVYQVWILTFNLDTIVLYSLTFFLQWYLVLSGSAKWYVNGELVNSKPGEFIHHPPRATHQMITEDQPILALWMRTGELEGNYWFVKKKASKISRS